MRTTRYRLVIDNVDPAQLVSADRRIYHDRRARICAYWRELARDAVLAEYGQAKEGEVWYEYAHVTIFVRFPDRFRHDVGNLYSYVARPIVDGLVDGRLIRDDDDKHLVGPDMRRDPECGSHRIIIHVSDATR